MITLGGRTCRAKSSTASRAPPIPEPITTMSARLPSLPTPRQACLLEVAYAKDW
ncbi:hypothetical protein CPB85DRAFT_1324499 [Mucidula mucida]|nr:hypothetical protein CPB85DRAFT_1324466 [Mucidula mucida]KAF8900972.1 hypothetical protein CPB85DRAFT_1324499 [Mucidula mucida]